MEKSEFDLEKKIGGVEQKSCNRSPERQTMQYECRQIKPVEQIWFIDHTKLWRPVAKDFWFTLNQCTNWANSKREIEEKSP